MQRPCVAVTPPPPRSDTSSMFVSAEEEAPRVGREKMHQCAVPLSGSEIENTHQLNNTYAVYLLVISVYYM